MVKHLIRHYGKYIYRHEDYQAICQGDDCAAQILSLFEFWTTCRLEEIKRTESYNEQNKRSKTHLLQIPDLWLYETIEDISSGMLHAYGDSSIRKSLKKLIEWEFINYRKSPNTFDRTKEYRFNTELIQSSLDQWRNAQTTENSEPLEKTLETVKTTHEPLNLQDDLYSLNSLNKQSLSTGDAESDLKEVTQQSTASLSNNPQPSGQPEDSHEGINPAAAAPLLNQIDNSFVAGRPQNPYKQCGLSVALDPWMVTAKNPDKEFAQWVANKRYADKSKTPLADAKAEIRNNSDRASDLWDEYQAEMTAKTRKLEVMVQIPLQEAEAPRQAKNQGVKDAFADNPELQAKADAVIAALREKAVKEKVTQRRTRQ
ncbi:MAG: hypothetical protein ACKPDM_14910 [Dolichospermum sp.]